VIHRGIKRSKWADAFRTHELHARGDRITRRKQRKANAVDPKLRHLHRQDAADVLAKRRELGLSQDQLARLLDMGLTGADIAAIEHCRRMMPKGVLRTMDTKKLAKAAAALLKSGPDARLTKAAEQIVERKRATRIARLAIQR
jgi:DNA-binding transcriptional regulator YiaG